MSANASRLGAPAPGPAQAGGIGIEVTRAPREVRFAFVEPAAGAVQLAVYARSGEQVWSDTVQHAHAGSNSYRWDTRDRTHQKLPAGPYFLRVATARAPRFAPFLLRD